MFFEQNFGSVEGMLFKEVFDMAAAAGKSWPAFNPPGAETLSQVQQRFVEFFKVRLGYVNFRFFTQFSGE